jgi:hypothetical protein
MVVTHPELSLRVEPLRQTCVPHRVLECHGSEAPQLDSGLAEIALMVEPNDHVHIISTHVFSVGCPPNIAGDARL